MLIAFKNDYEYGIIFLIGLCFINIIYVIINLPFLDFYQNYRTVLIQLTNLFILFNADYYRIMKSNIPLQIKGKIYSPAII